MKDPAGSYNGGALIKAPFLNQGDIQKAANNFRLRYWSNGTFPVDIIRIAEFDLKLNIEPVSGLKTKTNCDALLTGDCKSIIVDLDEFMNDKYENRMRFSFAHEIGHLILHKNIYLSLSYDSVDEWIKVMLEIPTTEYHWIEYQANEFAGRLLVPPDALTDKLNSSRGEIIKVRSLLGSSENSSDFIKDYMSRYVCRDFGVSHQVIAKRIEREKVNFDLYR